MALASLVSLLISIVSIYQAETRGGGGHRGGGHRGGEFRGGPASMGERARFEGHYDNMGHWGGWGRRGGPQRWGRAGGWARPNHRFYGYGWGGWYSPNYAVGSGYALDPVNRQILDDEASMYTASDYAVAPGAVYSSIINKKKKNQAPKIIYKSRYKLGPDADIIDGGRIAFHLTDGAFLLVDSGQLLVVDQKSGESILALFPDPTLMWHLSSEVKQQALGLSAAMERKKSQTDSKSVVSSKELSAKLKTEITNLSITIELLSKAKKCIGTVPSDPPAALPPPEKKAIEIFASTWMLADGSLVVIKRKDGSYAYIDGRGIYADKSKSALKQHYPDKFELVVWNYLNGLIKEAPDTNENLKDDFDSTQWALEQLAGEAYNQRKNKGATSDDETAETLGRLTEAIGRTEHRHLAISNQLSTMSEEIEAAKLTLATLKK